jgi:hypothetical protein
MLLCVSRVTQRVEPEPLIAALAAGGRAAIAFARDGALELLPVRHRRDGGGRHWLGIAREDAPPAAGLGPVVLVLDAGRAWFELRAVTWRGHAHAPVGNPPEPDDELAWLVFEPSGVIAWDYGQLREERAPT